MTEPKNAKAEHDLSEAIRILTEHQQTRAYAEITFHFQAGRITRADIKRQQKFFGCPKKIA